MRYRPTPSGLARDINELTHILALALSKLDRKVDRKCFAQDEFEQSDDAGIVS